MVKSFLFVGSEAVTQKMTHHFNLLQRLDWLVFCSVTPSHRASLRMQPLDPSLFDRIVAGFDK